MVTTITDKKRPQKKALQRLDMIFFSVCAILVVDSLSASASIGVSSIFWWLLVLILYFIPYGLITAELGSAYPEGGGLYDWVKLAFGKRWAARTIWLYWIHVALWMPSVYIIFANIFAQLFFPTMQLWEKIFLSITITWITIFTGILKISSSKWVTNLGALVKAAFFLFLGAGAFWHLLSSGPSNDLSFKNILPAFNDGLFYLPVIVHNFMGFELLSGATEEMQDPQRDIPITIVISGALIAFFYLLGTISLLSVLPLESIGLVDGIIDTLRLIFRSSNGEQTIVILLGIMVLFSFFSNLVSWSMGVNWSAAKAGREGAFPAILGKLHSKNRTPSAALIITGFISTVVILLYGSMAQNAEDLFWSIFSFSSMVFALSYVPLFPAFLRMRIADPDHPRPYRIPGGLPAAILFSICCLAFILMSIIFFVWVPGKPMDWSFAGPVLSGLFTVLMVGEWVIRKAEMQRKYP